MMDDVTLAEALPLLAERGKVLVPRGKGGKKVAAKKVAPKAADAAKPVSAKAVKPAAKATKPKPKPKAKAKPKKTRVAAHA